MECKRRRTGYFRLQRLGLRVGWGRGDGVSLELQCFWLRLGSFRRREALSALEGKALNPKPNAGTLAASPFFEAGVLEEQSRGIRVAGLGV